MTDQDIRAAERKAQDDALALGRLAAMRARLGNRGPGLLPVEIGEERVLGYLVEILDGGVGEPFYACCILDGPWSGLTRGEIAVLSLTGNLIRVPEWFLDGGAP